MTNDAGFLRGGGAMGALIRAYEWVATPLGPPETWPQALRSAIDLCLHSSFPTAIYWGPELRLLYNDAWAPIPAERHPDALGRPGAEVWSEIWPIIAPQFQRVLDSGEGFAAFDQMLPMARGGRVEETWWTYSFTPIRSEDGTIAGVLNQGNEVTAHVRTQHALRESEGKFRGITNSVDQMIWSTLSDGFHDYYNDRWYEFTGVPAGSTDGEAWNDMFHPEDRERAWGVWRHSLETGETYHIEYRLKHHSGTYRWVLGRAQPVRDAKGDITRWFGSCTDIQEIVDAREVLARSRAELERQVAERTRERNRLWAMTNDLMGTAGLDGYLKAVNPAWTRMLGWSDAELLARPFSELVDKSDHAATADVVRRLSLGETVDGFVDHVFCKDGRLRTIMWSAVPEGALFYIVGRDITEQRNAEEALRQSQKMEAVGQLTGGLAHDFNNLLTGISGSLELLQTRVSQGRLGDVDRYVNAAQGAAKRAAALTHRLLAFSRRQTLDPKPTDVNRLVVGMEELVRRTIGPHVTLEVVAAGGLWLALVDPSQLENALLNLCINARDAMPDGGRITIETANKWMDERAAKERDLDPGQYLSLCVTDTGTGMTPEVIARAFDPFFTTKPIGQGTGLGLSMIYGFVRQSGGQVRIYSEIGAGTTMCLYLPRHYGAAEDVEGVPDLSGAPRADAGETVLIVDDEPTVRMLVIEVLEDLGYTAIEAADGAGGLKVLQSDVRIDLLVTDVGLPGGMNGRQLADAGRVLRPTLKVLFITGYAENAVLGHGHLDRDMQVLTKPFVMEALASRIRDLIAGS
ncbi:hybrid sensor histidine kinase/response regulator [Methylobacterium sp. WL9]|uniref:hybrid sensor histidine kinase/response regulator n=1 Tax=Methylobacterium sp. WL9 TaxID=2603898 RepID=UPI0011CAE130|nr:hybrid sensor histidine kinase/response regulator [Methylobacterium sp. WL9]TXN19930.1 PAS domain S-box protein [Methylobacterium sp. WL9]